MRAVKSRRFLTGLSLFCLLAGLDSPVFAVAAPSVMNAHLERILHKKPAEPDLTEVLQTEQRFRKALAYSYNPSRSGQLFFLTRKYAPVMFDSGNYSLDGFSHLNGKKIPNEGATHGMVWDYDIEIPMIFYGPGRVKTRTLIDTPASLQDLVPTYAHLMGAISPRDALHGRVLHQAFLPNANPKPPKVILTVVFDQGGWQYYRAHPGLWPHVQDLMRKGTTYTRATIQHLDVETAVGHTAIGTGAYPYQHGIISNHFYLAPLGANTNLLGPDRSPVFINSPSLADVWDLQKGNKPFIFSYAYAPRASIGMAGHGAMYQGGDKDMVLSYDHTTGTVGINQKYYELPDYLKAIKMQPYLDALVDRNGQWFGHKIDDLEKVNMTPAQARFDADVFLTMLEHEPVGQDEITDLLYLTLKSTDACGHAFGSESDECGAVLAEQDKQFQRILEALEHKVGKENLLVVLTADHGGSPLEPLVGGQVIKAEQVKADLNRALDHVDNGVPLVYDMLASQIYVDEAEMRRNQLDWEDLRSALQAYEIEGKPAFLEVMTRREVSQLQADYGLDN